MCLFVKLIKMISHCIDLFLSKQPYHAWQVQSWILWMHKRGYPFSVHSWGCGRWSEDPTPVTPGQLRFTDRLYFVPSPASPARAHFKTRIWTTSDDATTRSTFYFAIRCFEITQEFSLCAVKWWDFQFLHTQFIQY